MHQLQADLVGAVVEHRAHDAAFVFGMGVIGLHVLEAQRLEDADIVQPAVQGVAPLIQADAHAARFFVLARILVIVPMRVAVVRMAGHAVAGLEEATGDTQMPTLAHPGHAQRAAGSAQGAVGQNAAGGRIRHFAFGGQARIALGIAGDVDVATVAQQAIGMEDPARARGLGAAIHAEHAGALIAIGAGAQLHAAAERRLRQGIGRASIDDVHCAADRAAAVKEGGRALHHLDPVGEERLDADGVVGAERGDIPAAHAIVDHLHARAIQPANDRAAHARAKRRALDAWAPLQGLAERVGLGFVQLLARQHFHRPDQLFRGLVQRRGGHHHAVELVHVLPVRVLLGRFLGLQGGGQREAEPEGMGQGVAGGADVNGSCHCVE